MKNYYIFLFAFFFSVVTYAQTQLPIQSLGLTPFAYSHAISVSTPIEGEIYYLGGNIGSPYVYNASDTLWKFNLTLQSWSNDSFYLPYGIFDYSVASYLDDHIYLSPGFATGNSNGWGNHVKMIDVDLPNQIALETHSFPGFSTLWNANNCESNGKIYFFGGHNGQDQTEIFEYDPIVDTLVYVADLINPTAGGTVIMGSDGWIYILGRWEVVTPVQRFNPVTYQTEVLSTSMKAPRNYWNITSLGEVFFFYSQSNDSLLYRYNYITDMLDTTQWYIPGQFENTFSISDPNNPAVIYTLKSGTTVNDPDELLKISLPSTFMSMQIQMIANTPFNYDNIISVSNQIDGNIYLLGGNVEGFSIYNASDTIWKYNLSLQSWSHESYYLPYGIFDYSAASYVNNHIYLSPGFATGNSNGWGNHVKMIDVDLPNQIALETHSFPGFSTLWNANNCESNGKIYFFGGHNGQDQTEIFEYDPIVDTLVYVADLINPTAGGTVIMGSDGWIYILGRWEVVTPVQRFNPVTYQTEVLSTSMKAPRNYWNITSLGEVYFFYQQPNDTLIYRYDYINDELDTTQLYVSGMFENTFCIADPNDPSSIYSLKSGTSLNDPDKIVKITLPIYIPENLNTDFIASNTNIFEGNTIQFTDLSSGNPTTWQWIFEGGTPGISADQNPIITFNSSGQFDVTLIIGNGLTSDTLYLDNYIFVNPVNSNTGLSAYYPFNNNTNDESGNGNDGTLYGGVGPTVDRFNNSNSAFYFDGVNDAIRTSNMFDFSRRTVCAWINIESFPTSVDEIIFTNDGNSSSKIYGSFSCGVNSNNELLLQAGGSNSATIPNPDLNEWYFIVLIQDSNTVSYYLNNQHLFDTLANNSCSQSSNGYFRIGEHRDAIYHPNGWYNFNGKVDDVRIYDLVLSANDIDSLYHLGGWPITSNLVADFTANSGNVNIGQSIQFTDLSTGNPTSWQWTFEGGTPPTSTQQNPLITYNSQGLFDVTLIVGNGQIYNTLVMNDYIQVPSPVVSGPNWYFTVTGSNHSTAIQNTIPITIDSVQISAGDYIGVFYDSLGTLACGGYLMWQNSNTVLAAWGEDVGNDGFTIGEEFTWKLWRASDGLEIIATAEYLMPPLIPNEAYFAANGLSALNSLKALTIQYQSINLSSGWSIFSTYINPFQPLVDSVFGAIETSTTIVKNGMGNVYWPAFGVNLIGNIVVGQGYQVKMITAEMLEIGGAEILPEQTSISISTGWSLIAYLRQVAGDAIVMMSPIANDLIILKNGAGQVYWPQFNVNLIGNMLPGQGYQIKMNSAQTLVYPPNTSAYSKSNIQTEQPEYFKSCLNTGSNMTLGIPLTSWETMPDYGDEVAVFTKSGLLVGSGVFTGDNMAITLWGDDEYSTETDGLSADENFTVRIWNKDNQSESEILIETWLEGDASYETNKIAVAAKLSTQNSELRTFELYQNTPNPFTGQTEFSFYLPKPCKVEFELFNIIGEKVGTLASENFESGKHSLIYRSGSLSPGSYYYRLQTPEFSQTRKMTILK